MKAHPLMCIGRNGKFTQKPLHVSWHGDLFTSGLYFDHFNLEVVEPRREEIKGGLKEALSILGNGIIGDIYFSALDWNNRREDLIIHGYMYDAKIFSTKERSFYLYCKEFQFFPREDYIL